MIDFNNISDEEREKLGQFYLKELEKLWDFLSNEENIQDDVLKVA